MEKFSKKILFVFIATLLVLSACVPSSTPTAEIIPITVTVPPQNEVVKPVTLTEETSSAPITTTDALGRTVTLEKVPERIVIAGKAVIMLTDAVYLFPDIGNRVVGVSNLNQGHGDFIGAIDPTFGEKEKLANDIGPEQIAALQPDLVILKSSMAEKLGSPLETQGIPVIYLDFETPEQYQRDLATLGQVFQNDTRAQELAAYFSDVAAKVSSATAGMDDTQKPRVLLLYYSTKDGNVAFNVAPESYIQTYMVQTAGGIPVWLDIELDTGWTKVNLEQIAAWDPDQIFVVTYTENTVEIVDNLKEDPNWQALKAVANNQIYAFPADFYSWDQPDVRWILGLKWLATKIQPDLWSSVDMLQETKTFYQTLYGIDEAIFNSQVSPLLTGIE